LKGESLVKDTATPGVEGTREGQESSDLTDSLADKDEPETDEGISEKSTTGTGSGDGRTGGQEETGTDGTRDSDHDHVAETEITLETLLFGSHMDLTLTDILHLVDLVLFRHLVSVFEFGHFVLVVKVEGWVGKESCEKTSKVVKESKVMKRGKESERGRERRREGGRGREREGEKRGEGRERVL
jgi:hypothetical protein